jgi:hypothetical protein
MNEPACSESFYNCNFHIGNTLISLSRSVSREVFHRVWRIATNGCENSGLKNILEMGDYKGEWELV